MTWSDKCENEITFFLTIVMKFEIWNKKNMVFLHNTQHSKIENSQRKSNYKWKIFIELWKLLLIKTFIVWSNWMTLIWKTCLLRIVLKNSVFNHSTILKKLKTILKLLLKTFSKKFSKSKTKFSILTILQISEKTWIFLNNFWS